MKTSINAQLDCLNFEYQPLWFLTVYNLEEETF